MQTILGPFHPHLESAFVAEIIARKNADPFCPLLVLVPSDALRRHLKQLLSRQHQLSLINLHLLTFYQLSARLFTEAHGTLPELRDDLFFEEVVRQLVRTRQAGTAGFAGIDDRAGGCAALWQTLRDLRDGLVDPHNALEALRESHFAGQKTDRTEELLRLFQSLSSFCDAHAIRNPSDLDQFAARQTPSSPFLRQFEQIFYYGFYDLTQIQLEVFHAVARNYPTTLFFPLLGFRPSHDGWSFAERFYERHVQGYTSEASRELVDPAAPALPLSFRLFDEHAGRSYESLPVAWHCTLSNSFGVQDEVSAAAKEILRLADDEQIEFAEIGVVARSLEDYGDAIGEIFRAHRIPLRSSLAQPLVQFPLTKAVILLFNLPAKDFLRSQVIDLLSSPYFRPGHSLPGGAPRPDLWDLASRELAICKGVHEWRRLRNYLNRDLVISQLSGDDEARVIRISAAQLRSLADIVDELAADLLVLPDEDSWSGYAAAYKTLLEKYFAIGGAPSTTDTAHDSEQEKILALLEQIAGLDSVSARVALKDFSQTFEHWLERSSLESFASGDGVTVLNAAAARGLSFRALFILGLNEGVFPRTIREDAFLRDRERETLERDLGYKVAAKLAGFDEEKLLFSLLVHAARERLYVSFQRADESGRALSPSWYLGELKRALDGALGGRVTEITIPRSLTEKSSSPPFHRDDLLLPEELAIRLMLDNQDPAPLIESFAAVPELYKNGRKAVIELEQSGDQLRAFDGAVGPLADHWQHFVRRGISPTALETYARCPYQFFARHVLGLERLDRPEDISGPSPADYGELGHAILNGVYQAVGESSGPARSIDDLAQLVDVVAQRVFADYENNQPVGYALTWQCLKEQLTELIRVVVGLDLRAMAESGFIPTRFEADATDRLPDHWPEPLRGATIRGRMDRIDLDADRRRLRVIDYKFKFGADATAQDKNLDRAALRGERLQPPFYSLLGANWARTQGAAAAPREIGAEFYYLAPRWSEGPLVTARFDGAALDGKLGAEIVKTIAYLAGGIRDGWFFIQRGPHCSHCDVAEICRKNHPPSLWRAENDPVTAPHRQLKDKDPTKL